MVKLRSFQNASIEIKQISFNYQQNRFTVKKLICKMKNENNFTDKRFLLTVKRNPQLLKDFICRLADDVRLRISECTSSSA